MDAVHVRLVDVNASFSCNFWRSDQISQRSRQKGLQYAAESYFQHISISHVQNTMSIEGKCHRSQRKKEPPHNVIIQYDVNTNVFSDQHCSCNAGLMGYCSHVLGLVNTIDLWKGQDLQDIPVQLSCTSMPQQWHKPRGAKIAGEPVSNVIVAKAKIQRKRKPVLNQTRDTRLVHDVTDEDLNLLRGIAGTPISYIVSKPELNVQVNNESYPVGSGLSYQLPLSAQTENPTLGSACGELELPLPLDQLIKVPLMPFATVNLTNSDCRKIAKETRMQHKCDKWHEQRKGRITASRFGDILKRKKITDSFIKSIYDPQNFTSKSVCYGTCNEDIAKQQYLQKYPNRHLHDCGLLVQPSLPFLGASPDGIVCDNGETGLIEVKCPYSARDMTVSSAADSIKDYYVVRDGTSITVSQDHKCYAQIQGQLMLSGLTYCDLIIYTKCDLFEQRIYPDNIFTKNLLSKLIDFHDKYFKLSYLKT